MVAKKKTDILTVVVWAVDFLRAMDARPWWARLLFEAAAGKRALGELEGLKKTLEERGFYTSSDFLPDIWGSR